MLLLFLKKLHLRLLNLTWLALVISVVLHFGISWLLLLHAEETGLIDREVFWYFYTTTASTVGYGDLSPTSLLGRIYTTFWVIPGGIVLFAAFLAKLSHRFVNFWRKAMQGRVDYSMLEDHIVILGWHDEKTRHMIKLILGDEKSDQSGIVLCATQAMENPCPDDIKFVHGNALTHPDMLSRAAIATARQVIIHADSDDLTLATCLAVSALRSKTHIVAYFDRQTMADLLKAHCPTAECITTISVERLVRSAQDPGSSRVQTQLLSTLTGPTQFSIQVPDSFAGMNYGQLFYAFKEQYDATILGLADTANGDDLTLNPATNHPVKANQTVYFMAPKRLRNNEIDWQRLIAGYNPDTNYNKIQTQA